MTTIVTAFYPLEHSKHGLQKYMSWIGNFCKIPRPMVIFTDAKMALRIGRLRDNKSQTHVIVKEFDSYDMTSPAQMEIWRRNWHLDPEASIHNPELYAVWAIKQECVARAILENPFGHDWFVWCDIGIQRDPAMQSYYQTFGDAVGRLCTPGRIHFLEVESIPDALAAQRGQVPMPYPPPSVTLGGGCIAGDRAAWGAFSARYMGMLREFDTRGWFAGKDQVIYYAMLMERTMPFRLFRAIRFGTLSQGDKWMSFPVILGGQAPVTIDDRFDDIA